jgi:hypothetical protein
MDAQEWGIPILDLGWQATDLPGAWTAWGSVARTSWVEGGYHFYVRDYKFSSLWRRWEFLSASGCSHVVEVNFSAGPETARAVVLHDVWRKRVLSSAWGTSGVRLLADLNMEACHLGLGMLGIPEGWRAYATRKHHGDWNHRAIEYQHERACLRAGTDDLLFVVFGGGFRTRDYCARRSWRWVPERSDAARRRAVSDTMHGCQPLTPDSNFAVGAS